MNQISQISSELSAALAVDLAAGMWPEGEVFERHGIDAVRGASLLQQDWFRKMVDEAKKEWSSINSAKERIKLKAQVAVEQSIADLFAIVVDGKTPAAARVAAFKELKDVAGVSVQDSTGSAANVPSVNIYLNGNAEPAMTITAPKVIKEDPVIDVTPSNLSDDDDFLGMAPLGG